MCSSYAFGMGTQKQAMDVIYSAIGKFLSILDGFTHSYILALLIFAIIVEILLLPFGIRQQKNSIKQAKLRPKEMAIRKKYAGRNDQPTQQKITQEIQELYTNEGYNPMGGCLPLLELIQICIQQIAIGFIQLAVGAACKLLGLCDNLPFGALR